MRMQIGMDMCAQALENVENVVRRVRPEALGEPTPCSDWDVQALVNHMVGVLNALTKPARGEPFTFNPQQVEDVPGNDLARAFSGGAADFVAAWSEPGVGERVVETPFGEQPASLYLGLATAEMLLHGWDLATAVGVPYSMSEEAAGRVLANMQQLLKPEMRGDGKAFAQEVPTDSSASVQVRLLAFSGRRAA
jgi:uncharacterized protein (TIGR03086 family)